MGVDLYRWFGWSVTFEPGDEVPDRFYVFQSLIAGSIWGLALMVHMGGGPFWGVFFMLGFGLYGLLPALGALGAEYGGG